MSTANNELVTRFDCLPTEIIYVIFNYLSSTDILNAFFNLSQRFNNILFKNDGYLNYFKFSAIVFNTWKDILSVIGPHIKYLNLDSFDLSIPLDPFTNLKSLIISSLLPLPDQTLKVIFESDQFNNLHLLKINQQKIFFDEVKDNYPNNQDYVLAKVFNSNNSLEQFHYSSIIPSFIVLGINRFQINSKLTSLTLTLTHFEDIFPLVSFTPNLEYLNIHSLLTFIPPRLTNNIYINLEKLSLTFGYMKTDSNIISSQILNFNCLANMIKQFSLSLTYLSLNLVHTEIDFDNTNQFISNADRQLDSIQQLREFLKSMGKLKQFHLYSQLSTPLVCSSDLESEFNDQYWKDHRGSFGTHGDYLYTLPFHFDYIYNFPISFDHIILFNRELLPSNVRLWGNVKSIELSTEKTLKCNFLQELSIQMSKLTFIKFSSSPTPRNYYWEIIPTIRIEDIEEKNIIILNTVKKIEFIGSILKNENDWLSHLTPNLQHLILSSCILPRTDKSLTAILNNKIQQLDTDNHSQLAQLIHMTPKCFSNVHVINFCLKNNYNESQWCADIIMDILRNFKNLKILLIYVPSSSIFHGKRLTKMVECLNMDEIRQNYHIKHFPQYFLFSKRLF